MNFKFSELFQDTDGGTSAKRFAFFIVLAFFIIISTLVLFHGVSADLVGFAGTVTDKCKDLIQWLGGYILLDKAPAVMRAATGGDKGTRTMTTIEKVEPPVTGG